MNLKEFLKPDWRKFIGFLIIVALITIIFQSSVMGGCCTKETNYFVLPFPSIIHREVNCNSPLASPECKSESSFKINYPYYTNYSKLTLVSGKASDIDLKDPGLGGWYYLKHKFYFFRSTFQGD